MTPAIPSALCGFWWPQTYFLSHLGSGYKACYSAALYSAWDDVGAEGPACLLSDALCLHTIGNICQPELGCP